MNEIIKIKLLILIIAVFTAPLKAQIAINMPVFITNQKAYDVPVQTSPFVAQLGIAYINGVHADNSLDATRPFAQSSIGITATLGGIQMSSVGLELLISFQ